MPKRDLVRRIDERSSTATGTVVIGGGGGGGGLSAHALDGPYHTGTLDDTQGPQFLLIDGSRDLIGNLGVADGITIDGVDISEFYATVGTIGDRTVLGGPGIYSDEVTFSVGSPTVEVDLATGSKLTFVADQLALDLAADFPWTGTHSWVMDLQVDANIDFIGAQEITTTAGNLNIVPMGDLVLDPQDDDVLPGGTMRVDLGDHNRRWRSIHGAELVVNYLVAEETIATTGGNLRISPSTFLMEDLEQGATSMTVKHNNLQIGDYLEMRAAPFGLPQFEILQVSSGPTPTTVNGETAYIYGITRGLNE